MSDKVPDILKDLAAGITTAVEVQNRYWFALAVTSLFAIVPQYSSDKSNEIQLVSLPLGLPKVESAWFVPAVVLLLSVLVVAFASAQAHLIRTQMLARRILQRRREFGSLIGGEDERDFLEALRAPSLTRVSSIVQVLLGTHQFFIDKEEQSPSRRHMFAIIYGLLKALVLIVWLMLPAGALIFSSYRYSCIQSPPLWAWRPFVWVLVGAAGVSLTISSWLEMKYWWDSVKRAWA